MSRLAARTRPDHPRLSPRHVHAIGVRVSVVGKGKTPLAALVAGALRRRGLTVHCNSPRPADDGPRGRLTAQAAALGLALDDAAFVERACRALHEAWPVQAVVLANHAAGAAGQRRLHEQACRPHEVLVASLDRASAIGLRSPAAAARRLVGTIPPGAAVLCGEPDPACRAALRRACEQAGLAFLDAVPRRPTSPGTDLVALLDAFLVRRYGKGLDADEEALVRREVEGRNRWSASSLPGVRWFDASALEDLRVARAVLGHLQAQRRHPVTFVAYAGASPPGLARELEALLRELIDAPDTRQVVLCGARAESIADRLDQGQVRVVPDHLSSATRLVRRLQFDSQGGAVVLLGDGESAWAQEFARQLRPTGAAAGRPARPESSGNAGAPRRSVRPMVAAAMVKGAMDELAEAMTPGSPGAPAPPATGSGTPLARAVLATATAVAVASGQPVANGPGASAPGQQPAGPGAASGGATAASGSG